MPASQARSRVARPDKPEIDVIAQQPNAIDLRQHAGFLWRTGIVDDNDLERDFGQMRGDGGKAPQREIGMAVGRDNHGYQRHAGTGDADILGARGADQAWQ